MHCTYANTEIIVFNVINIIATKYKSSVIEIKI